jgi:hypothetical protein
MVKGVVWWGGFRVQLKLLGGYCGSGDSGGWGRMDNIGWFLCVAAIAAAVGKNKHSKLTSTW